MARTQRDNSGGEVSVPRTEPDPEDSSGGGVTVSRGEHESDTLERGEIFEILSNDRRRYTIHYLKQQPADTTATLREIVDQVAAWENGTEVERLDSGDRKTVYTALKQTHLPRLDDFGVVEYDQQRGEVRLADTADQVQLYMEYVPEGDISWSQYYLGLSGLCVAITAGAWFGVPFLASAGWIALTGLFVAAFAVSSVVHQYTSRRNRIGSPGRLKEMERP